MFCTIVQRSPLRAVTRVRAGQPKTVVRNPAAARIFLLQVVQTSFGAIRSPVQWTPKVVSLAVKRPDRAAEHSIKAEVKHERNYAFTYTYIFMMVAGQLYFCHLFLALAANTPFPFILCDL